MVHMHFALRHWTAIILVVIIAAWAIFYLPGTPSYAIFELKQSVDARNGSVAASYVDFKKVVQNAGYEMVQDQNSSPGGSAASNIISQFVGGGAIMFPGPIAALLQQWLTQQVNDGAKQLQMPPAAIAGAILLMHRNDGTAYTQWTDHKGQVWEVRMEREPDGWKIVQVKNVAQLLEQLKRQHNGQLTNPPS
jgi:hypothetical protein